MKRIFLSIIILSLMISQISIGYVSADSNYSGLVGVEMRLDQNAVTEYTGNYFVDKNGVTQYQYEATIYPYPIFTDDNEQIDLTWYIDGDRYYSGDNLFEATIEGSKTLVTYEGESLYWDPIVVIGKDQYSSIISDVDYGVDRKSQDTPNILTWDYKVCQRVLTLEYGAIKEEYIFNSDPGGDIQIVSNQHISEGFDYISPVYAYDADHNLIPITEDKYISYKDLDGVKYPITIDPSASFSQSSVVFTTMRYTDAVYNTAWAASSAESLLYAIYIGQDLNAGPSYYVYRTALYFDSSSIPDSATVTSANISIPTLYSDASDTDFTITIQHGTSSTYPHNPLEVGDWDKSLITDSDGTLTTSGLSAPITINLDASGLAQISKTGWTKFYVRSSLDIAGTSPSGNEYIYLASAGTMLNIVYSASAVPTVTTKEETSVGTDSVTLNGYLDNDNGNESCLYRFSYGTSSGSYGTSTTWTGSIKTGDSFSQGITGLSSDTMYYYRAEVQNDVGQGNGSERSFRTEEVLSFSAPSILSAVPESSEEVLVTWSKGYATYATMLRYKIGAYPSSTSDGTLLYNGSLTSYEHTGLSAGVSYYYRVWGVNSSGGYTTDYTDDMATTFASIGVGNITSDVPTSGWYNNPTNSSVSGLPFAALVEEAATDSGVASGSLWLILAIAVSMMIGAFAYTMTGSVIVAAIVIMIGLAGGSIAGVIPFWVIFMFGVISFGCILLMSRSEV